jgi:hypothetical protein
MNFLDMEMKILLDNHPSFLAGVSLVDHSSHAQGQVKEHKQKQ